MIEFVIVFSALVAGHCVADYPLQGDFLSRAKNRFQPIPGVPWYQALGAHAIIHGGIVAVIASMLGVPALLTFVIGLGETIAHAVIDDTKCRGSITYNVDQALHVMCKIVWALIIISFV